MHAQDNRCAGATPNPADLGSRDANDPANTAFGGEYAPFILPARYNEHADGRLTLYFAMSTWNPYQVVQMKTDLERPTSPWWKRLLISKAQVEHWP